MESSLMSDYGFGQCNLHEPHIPHDWREQGSLLWCEGIEQPGKVIQKWGDPAMYSAEKHEDPQKPKVTLTYGPNDPLGLMAMTGGLYQGKVHRSPADVTDKERHDAWKAATDSKLAQTPLEWVQFSILFENVTRAFTHQLVRTRTATYVQESMRFAVKEDVAEAVKLPPSIDGTTGEWQDALKEAQHKYARMESAWDGSEKEEFQDGLARLSQPERWRHHWDDAVNVIQEAYESLVNDGMPAEDARGLLPTNTLTRVHMRVDLKSLLNLAGLRLCTQAQWEWRVVFAELAKSIREYGDETEYENTDGQRYNAFWQYELISDAFRPVCYAANKCTMKGMADRHCSIRERVDEFESAGIPSSEWGREHIGKDGIRMDGIQPVEWLANPRAAIPREW